MTVINDKTLSMAPGKRLELYTVDLSHVDGPMLRFTPNLENVTPSEVYRFEDTGNTRQGAGINLADSLPPSTKATVTFYARVPYGATFPSCSISSTLGDVGAGTHFRVRINPTDLAVTQGLASNLAEDIGTEHFGTVTSAAEFMYVTLTFITPAIMPVGGLWFNISPAMGLVANFAVSDGTISGVLDVFGITVHRMVGGTRVPIMGLPEPLDWDVYNMSISVEANTSSCVKVPVWQGEEYTPIPIKATGFEKNGVGQFPKPLLAMSNITGAGSNLMQVFGDIRGAAVTRTRLYAENLDNGSEPDPLAHYPPDVFVLTRRTRQNANLIEFELASRMDQQGVKLPRREITRNVCPWKYRTWNATTGQFNYADGDEGCPYTGASYYDLDGNTVVNPEDDKCSHQLETGCRARYGKDEELPFGAFPMVGRAQ
jgi:lambda family phage minor tail protein L